MTDTTITGRQPTPLLGDPLPASLAAYYDHLDHGRMAEASRCFAEPVVYALPPANDAETGPRAVTVGTGALLARFNARGARPWSHHVELCTVDGPVILVEGVLLDATSGATTATYLASAHLDADGLIDRYLAYCCPGARQPIPVDVGADVEPADVGHVVHEYFAAMDGGAFPAAARCFSADVLYSHPPYKHTGIDSNDRVEFHGRDELEAAFAARDPTAFDHRILACVQRGPHGIIEGVVENLPDGGTGSFLSSLSLDDAGAVRRYVSFYCEPGVPWR